MKKILLLFLFLFLCDLLSSQSINLNDTNSLASLLCSKVWTRYYVINGTITSDSVKDYIIFRSNKTFYKSSMSRDSLYYAYSDSLPWSGKWSYGAKKKTSIHDTGYSYITIQFISPGPGSYTTTVFSMDLYDWRMTKSLKCIKEYGNVNKPFITCEWRKIYSNDFGLRCYRQK